MSKKFILPFIILFFVILVLQFSLVLLRTQQKPQVEATKDVVSLILYPERLDLKVGETAAIQIMLSTGKKRVFGADAVVLYDPELIEIVDANPAVPGVQVGQGSVFPSFMRNKIDAAAGRISLSGSVFTGEKKEADQFNGQGVFGSFVVKALQPVESTILGLKFIPGGSDDSNVVSTDSLNEDLLEKVGNCRLTVN